MSSGVSTASGAAGYQTVIRRSSLVRGVAQRGRSFMSDEMALTDRRGRGGTRRKRRQQHRNESRS